MQIYRLFEIIYVLLGKKQATAKELAKRFEVSTRTIYRDVEALSMAGIPVFATKGRGGGIGLLDNFVLSKSILCEREQTEVLTALQGFAVMDDSVSGGRRRARADTATDSDGNAGDTLRKLNAFWNRDAANWLYVDFSDWGDKGAKIFQSLKSAILERRVVTFEYYGGNGVKSSRRVEPGQLCFKSKAWYMSGFCLDKNDDRLFKLSRIDRLCITDEMSSERRGARAASIIDGFGVDGQAGAGGGFGVATPFPEGGAPKGRGIPADAGLPNEQQGQASAGGGYGSDGQAGAGGGYGVETLVLKIDPRMAFRVFDDFDASHIFRQEDGSIIATPTWLLDEWAYSTLLSYGEYLEVVEPEMARAAIQGKLARMRENYSEEVSRHLWNGQK